MVVMKAYFWKNVFSTKKPSNKTRSSMIKTPSKNTQKNAQKNDFFWKNTKIVQNMYKKKSFKLRENESFQKNFQKRLFLEKHQKIVFSWKLHKKQQNVETAIFLNYHKKRK